MKKIVQKIMVKNVPKRLHAMTSEAARQVKLDGHKAEDLFALLVKGQVYKGSRKRDVVDAKGNLHSIKSGKKKWQMFLYGKNRFSESTGFLGAKLFVECLNVFPDKYADYLKKKIKVKKLLGTKMKALKEFLLRQENYFLHPNKKIFLQEGIFHTSEVDFFTIKENDEFHIFAANEVIEVLTDDISIDNSKGNLKVIFISGHNKATIGEIEIRTDEKNYKRVKFWMSRKKTLTLLKDKINNVKSKSEFLVTYGNAIKKFKI